MSKGNKEINKNKQSIAKQEIKRPKVTLYNSILVILFGIFLILFTTFKISGDDDIFWHLETGKYIVENKTVPSTDVFGFITSALPWIPFEWGWDVISYIVYSFSGYAGISILRTLIFVLVFYFIFRLTKKMNLPVWLMVLISTILIFGMIDRLIPKPQITSYLFFSAQIYILISFQAFNRDNIKSLYILPLLFLIWCNMHMGVLAGLGIFTIFIASESILYFKQGIKNSSIMALPKNDFLKLCGIYVLSIVTLFINPNGLNTYLYVFSHLNMKMLEDVFEWYSPFNKAFSGTMYQYIYMIFLCATVFVIYHAYKTKNIFIGLTSLVFAVFSVSSSRYTIDFMLIQSILIIITGGKFIIAKQKNNSGFLLYPAIGTAILLLVLTALIPANNLYNYIKYERSFGFGVDNRYYPVKLYNFIKENNIHKIGVRPFNSFSAGGYFLWELSGSKNFIDSRNLADDIYYRYKTINNKLPGYEGKLDESNFDYIAWSYPFLVNNTIELKTSIVSYLASNSNKWKLIYWDDQSMLFVKNEDKFNELINKYEYKFVNPLYYIHEREPLKKALSENSEGVKSELQRKYKDDPEGSFINSMVKSFKIPVNR